MYNLDKKKFGAFVAALRKEKGWTQKELAEKICISDKAVSKWETGISMPDVALLVPLAEVLEISVTELLQCQRSPQKTPMELVEVEDLVKTAISYSEKNSIQSYGNRPRLLRIYIGCVLVMVLEMAAMHLLGLTVFDLSEPVLTPVVLCSIFGLYFMVFAKERLPKYYDEYSINSFSDGPIRMNIPGVRISNRNWPYIIRVGRIWSMGMLVGYPALTIIMKLLAPEFFIALEKGIMLVLILGGLFVPLVIVGRKYQ